MAKSVSIMCENVDTSALKANDRLTFTTITGKDENNEYTWSQFSSFLATASLDDIHRAVDSLLSQANDAHHVFIEGFEKAEDGSFEVILGS